jgi:hypothetical protein
MSVSLRIISQWLVIPDVYENIQSKYSYRWIKILMELFLELI